MARWARVGWRAFEAATTSCSRSSCRCPGVDRVVRVPDRMRTSARRLDGDRDAVSLERSRHLDGVLRVDDLTLSGLGPRIRAGDEQRRRISAFYVGDWRGAEKLSEAPRVGEVAATEVVDGALEVRGVRAGIGVVIGHPVIGSRPADHGLYGARGV